MNSEPSTDRSVVAKVAQLDRHTARTASPLTAFLQKHLIGTIVLSTCINLGLTGAATWSVAETARQLQANVTKQARQQDLSGQLTYLDEVLTMSAQMFTNTGQLMWDKRYTQTVPVYDKAFAELTKDVPPSPQFDKATKKLFEIEDAAFKLAKQGNLKAASALLLNPDYQQNKQIYTTELTATIAKIKTNADTEIRGDRQALSDAILLASLGLGLLVITGALVVITVRGYIRDREQSQQDLQTFQSDLLLLNHELKQQAELRTEQQERIVTESATLQTDIGHILEIVSSLEDGNLTVRAEVSAGATGLISDTLNRLVESLHRIISVVLSNADRVAASTYGLDRLALETASQAQNQTRSIQQIEASIAQVNTLSNNSYERAVATVDAVQLAKAAIDNGQQEMSAMGDGIETLQQGTEQIVRRVQSLSEFVALAARFSKEQKRVAALTRVLALNASLLSTRALQEQDPLQFASLAHEFETIANQVNELAGETNNSLISLQYRTNQIQTVTSGLSQDITDIDRLVQKFTGEMNVSRQAFTNIQLVTDRVALMGEQVSISSQEIVRVANDALTAIQSIGIVAQNTEHKATVTREEVISMGQMAQQLLQMVEFFQLNESTATADRIVLPEDSTAVKNPQAVYQLLQSPS
ncbi:methyl-accepting chemotaxis protein [Chamaesiphon minutus]|uniref:Methyl-accepting chemotaxis protein n=1 Tax=Chamaesiphon minutus (strain ATCC 27169 / PCC 6605) TaxID=1173020 RepID=K9UL48_CHAP6|nr:methyl-accepting chemotaxis protein [Chamaesiphon minutus]AFY95802.1 methyl-accepting chemotaxis protein [Chamaesiphon minutus PCC 6605]